MQYELNGGQIIVQIYFLIQWAWLTIECAIIALDWKGKEKKKNSNNTLDCTCFLEAHAKVELSWVND